MKSKHAPPSFLLPRFLGRTEGAMIAHGHSEQLDIFRATLTPRAMLQVAVMFGLSDTNNLDKPQSAAVADIARESGYEPTRRPDGKTAFPTWIYQAIEETGLMLRKSFPSYIEDHVLKPDGTPAYKKSGKRWIPKMKSGLVDMAILQEFGFVYEDEDGQPIDLDGIPENQLIKYEADQGRALFAIPMKDKRGELVKNADGSLRRQQANGVTWTFSSRIARMAKDRLTNWIFYREALPILRRYLSKESSFRLMYRTLFWSGKQPQIEMSEDKLIEHLGIKTKDRGQAQKAIADAFADALTEKIIDAPAIVTERGYYQPTEKTNRPRRIAKSYRWKRAAKWQPGGMNIAEAAGAESDTAIRTE